jgi:ApbE superfamily uncharacterized protein (UPF0280 family)
MSGAVRQRLADGRCHFQHGPIDCIVSAEGDVEAVALCTERAWQRFRGVLDELVAELPLLRADLSSVAGAGVAPRGPIARRMVEACRSQATSGRFMTAMAAVAGSVAEELIGFFDEPRIRRAYVNNGGDVALHLGPGASFDVGLFTDPAHGLAGWPLDGRFRVVADSAVRGIATSGWRGRSFSLGIADSVTVLAATASAADAAATVIGNAVDVDDRRILRRPANEVRDDSDLVDRLVTRAVPALPAALVEEALRKGAEQAWREIEAGRIVAALLCLQGRSQACGGEDGPAAGSSDESVSGQKIAICALTD